MTVWVVGHSFAFWAHRHTGMDLGTQLGLDHLPLIQWLSHWRMLWDQLISALYEALTSQPEVLVLHLSENDLVNYSVIWFLVRLVEDIDKVKKLPPRARLGWADRRRSICSGAR